MNGTTDEIGGNVECIACVYDLSFISDKILTGLNFLYEV
jgi:hypothetical protein